jgi:alkaline phosphatase D
MKSWHYILAFFFVFATSPLSLLYAEAVHLAMGLKVGEVTSTEAIVWTRVTKSSSRKSGGVKDIGKGGPKEDVYIPSEVAVSDREGSVLGTIGQVRVVYSNDRELRNSIQTDWITVEAADDFTTQFRLSNLNPGNKYFLRVDAKPVDAIEITSSISGSFSTPMQPDQWQDVTFCVITGQAYRDLDSPEGFHIYPAMLKLDPAFLIPTGDTVYYDNDSPRARTMELARYHWHRMYSLPRLVEFHRFVPGYWLKDDHDILSDDVWPEKEPQWMAPMNFSKGLKIFREQVPTGDSSYRTIRWGKGLQIWLPEGREFRSSNPIPDGPDKSIWGKKQREWLLRTLKESDADFKVLINATPIVGPDRPKKADNHSNLAFAWEGNLFRSWTAESGIDNFYVACGDRHWQYLSVDPKTGLHEFSSGPVSDEHSGGTPGYDANYHKFHRVQGGFLSVTVSRPEGTPTISFRFHDIHGSVVYEFTDETNSK